ncbi:Cbb3-type cytochrome c oxidase subunit III [Paraburkholderia unamae]|uniref:c-type cytochrome n=1 Tax=Paraburkholderia unamae TaxID=219649 RepID=UPI001CB43F6F|nr:cytochrome c [Paraburkholderia unamae]CAG9265669.1 Cbb3-type cytochrome c oxidase subunit III [Paraburkholderia unamae]
MSALLSGNAWVNPFLGVLQAAQVALGGAAHVLGFAGDSHGQPAWPWPKRLAVEILLIDAGVARQLALALAATGGALLLAIVGLFWRKLRLALFAAAVLAAWFAPWPDTSLWLADAVPTSFQTTPFSVEAVARGALHYARDCAACHGDTGRGDGPRAASLVRWPPTVVGPLLGHRLDGELFWRVQHGMHARDGAPTMPAFASRLSDADTWAILDYLKVLAAGGGVRDGDGWPVPVALPVLDVRCGDAPAEPLARWRTGQRVRAVAIDASAPPPLEDPRWQTLLLSRDGALPPPSEAARWGASGKASCVAVTPGAWDAFAGIAGIDAQRFAGSQLIADRDGWLRAEAKPGDPAWADATLLCAAGGGRGERVTRGRADPLTSLLLRIDAEPVRYVKGGYVH